MGCHFLLQGIFPTQGSNPRLLHCLYHRAIQEAHLRHKQKQKSKYEQSKISVIGKSMGISIVKYTYHGHEMTFERIFKWHGGSFIIFSRKKITNLFLYVHRINKVDSYINIYSFHLSWSEDLKWFLFSSLFCISWFLYLTSETKLHNFLVLNNQFTQVFHLSYIFLMLTEFMTCLIPFMHLSTKNRF